MKLGDGTMAWIKRARLQLAALSDWTQRSVLFAEAVERLSPEEASTCFSSLLARGFTVRDLDSTILMQAALYSILTGMWSAEHQTLAREAAAAHDEDLTLAFLVRPVIPAFDEDRYKVPEYGTGRALSLGERKSLASKTNRRIVEIAMTDPHPTVASKLLENPKITEDDVVRISAKRNMPAALLSQIALALRWRFRTRVAFALIMNDRLPASVGLGLLPGLNPKLVRETAGDARLDIEIVSAANLLLAIR